MKTPSLNLLRQFAGAICCLLPFALQEAMAACSYSVQSNWNNGFVAVITLTNTGSATVPANWSVTANYPNGTVINGGWNRSQSGASPNYTFGAVASWQAIPPGGSQSFGVMGTKANGAAPAPIPTLTGALCGGAPPTPPPTPVPTPTPTPPPVVTPTPPVVTPTPPVGGGGGGIFRVDANGNITKNGAIFPMQCGSWFGLEGRHEPSDDPTNPSGAPMELYIGNTFWANGNAGTGRTIQQTMDEITSMGINVVRFPVAPQTLNANDPQGMGTVLKNHPSVRVPNARQALEEFIVAADQNDIEVILDIHSCSNYVGWRAGRLDARPPYVDADRDLYDFTREDSSCSNTGNPGTVTRIQAYNQQAWLNTITQLAGLEAQLGVDNIMGIDIFNEPWDYTWAQWSALAVAAYNAINSVSPNMLIFVQGISASNGNQDGSPNTVNQTPHGNVFSNPNWGENLFEAGANPPNIPQNRLVFSPHTYGPSVFVQRMFMDPAQTQCTGLEGDAAGDANCNVVINPTLLEAGWEEHFGYLKDLGYAVVVGEFGGHFNWPQGSSERDILRWGHITTNVDEQWQNALVDYMIDRNIEACYWSINPESGDTGGLYSHAYDPLSNTAGWGEWTGFETAKWNLLNRLWGN